jgi:hypothetical protein
MKKSVQCECPAASLSPIPYLLITSPTRTAGRKSETVQATGLPRAGSRPRIRLAEAVHAHAQLSWRPPAYQVRAVIIIVIYLAAFRLAPRDAVLLAAEPSRSLGAAGTPRSAR